MSKKTKILIVEDEGVVALHLESSILKLGYAVTGIAESKDEALNSINEDRPDLILMDILIKGSEDGIKTAEYVKKEYGIPIVFLTAHSDAATLAKAKLTEPFGYLIKPFEQRELAGAIEIAVFKSDAEQKLQQSRDALKNLNESLDLLVKKRTAELVSVNKKLKGEIAQKKLAEQELVASEHRYKGLFANAMDAIIAINERGEIQLFNPAAEKMFGYTVKEMLGKNVKLLMPNPDSSKHDGYIRKYNKSNKQNTSGNTRDVKAKKKDGSLFDVERRVHEVNIDEGVRYVGFIRDISKRIKAEHLLKEERRNRLTALIDGQEMERGRLAKELHDGLGQMLLGIKLSTSYLNKQLSKDAHESKAYRDTIDQIQGAMLEVSRMSQDLLPAILTDFGLLSALKKMVRLMNVGAEITIKLYVRGISERLTSTDEIGIYRITQEALSNAIKHSGAKNIHIKLVKNSKSLVLEITDNGRSFDLENIEQIGGSGLINMYQRAIILNGELLIESVAKYGTTVRLTINNL